MRRPVLITGCRSGIGLVTTTYLAERGIPVYAIVRSDHDRERVGAIPNVEAFVCDVTDDGQVAALRTAIAERFRDPGDTLVTRPDETDGPSRNPCDQGGEAFGIRTPGRRLVGCSGSRSLVVPLVAARSLRYRSRRGPDATGRSSFLWKTCAMSP